MGQEGNAQELSKEWKVNNYQKISKEGYEIGKIRMEEGFDQVERRKDLNR